MVEGNYPLLPPPPHELPLFSLPQLTCIATTRKGLHDQIRGRTYKKTVQDVEAFSSAFSSGPILLGEMCAFLKVISSTLGIAKVNILLFFTLN